MDFLRNLIDSGANFTQMTRERAEDLVNELVREGQVRTEEFQANVQDLLDRSRSNAERFNDMIREQVRSVLAELGIQTGGAAKRPARKTAAKRRPAKKAPAKKAATKRAPAKKAPAKKAAKKAATKRAPAKKAPARKATTKGRRPRRRPPSARRPGRLRPRRPPARRTVGRAAPARCRAGAARPGDQPWSTPRPQWPPGG